MRKLLVATRNSGKKREIRSILGGVPYEVVFPEDVGLYEQPQELQLETADTFEGNARKKAEYFQRLSRLPTVADDSGIEVFALGGAPGVHSRRFALAGPDQDEDAENNRELLRRLAGAPEDKRAAQYRCVVVFLADGAAIPHAFEGRCQGRILPEPRGTGGFGYDPLFFSNDLQQSFGEAPQPEKDAVSHRGRAFTAFADWLRDHPL